MPLRLLPALIRVIHAKQHHDLCPIAIPRRLLFFFARIAIAESSGGALAHSSALLALSGSTFESNLAGEEGYAVMSLGPLRSLDTLAFGENVRHCGVGTYGFEQTEVRASSCAAFR